MAGSVLFISALVATKRYGCFKAINNWPKYPSTMNGGHYSVDAVRLGRELMISAVGHPSIRAIPRAPGLGTRLSRALAVLLRLIAIRSGLSLPLWHQVGCRKRGSLRSSPRERRVKFQMNGD